MGKPGTAGGHGNGYEDCSYFFHAEGRQVRQIQDSQKGGEVNRRTCVQRGFRCLSFLFRFIFR